jgi:hypothetical protein
MEWNVIQTNTLRTKADFVPSLLPLKRVVAERQNKAKGSSSSVLRPRPRPTTKFITDSTWLEQQHINHCF